jgi:hypothetical protein
MTQHLIEEDNNADKQAMRRLGMVVAAFMVATVLLAISVGVAMG